MKKIYSTFLILVFTNSFAQLNTFFVKPIQTNSGYATAQDSHYVTLNTSVTSNNKLLVFIDGSGSNTKFYKDFPQLAANLGYHSVSVAYPNSPTVGSLCDSSTDMLCFDNVRQEICYGTPVSNYVSVDTLNSINNRLINLLQYLIATYPSDGWGQFISGENLIWNTVVVSGHSQGSGHAMYLGKTQNCDRVIMFSGVDDFSTHFFHSAHWLSNVSQTPVNKVFGFSHLQDDVEPYAAQYANLQTLGMITNGDDSTIVDGVSSPYNNSHCLYTNATPQHTGIAKYHNSTVVDYYTPLNGVTPAFNSVWTYLLTSTITVGIQQIKNKNTFSVFPNPTGENATVYFSGNEKQLGLKIFNELGLEVFYTTNILKSTTINILSFSPGIYFIRAESENNLTSTQKLIVVKK